MFFQVAFVNISQSADLLQDLFYHLGLGMPCPKYLKNPYSKLRNLLHMQLLFFHLTLKRVTFAKQTRNYFSLMFSC